MERSYFIGLLIALVLVVVHGRRYGQPSSPNTPGFCTLPPKPGPCRGSCPRYYFDARRGQCRPFTYGCCGGNANNFESQALCQTICQPETCPNVRCFIGPCTIQECPRFRDAVCRAACPCQSIWIYRGEDVSDRCH